MNIAFVFFITIGLLIIILSIFDVSMNARCINTNKSIEGFQKKYMYINPDEWDIANLSSILNNLNKDGVKYTVTNFRDHIDMLVNHFSSSIKIGRTEIGDFIQRGCFKDDGERYLKHRGPISEKGRLPEPPRRGWPGTTQYKNWKRDRDRMWNEYDDHNSPNFRYSFHNNYYKCKQ